jgi:hypothetical protein
MRHRILNMKKTHYPHLDEEFRRLRDDHHKAIRITAARGVLGAAVMRVYKRGTRAALMTILAEKINIDALSSIRDQKAFSRWYDTQLALVARGIKKLNKGNSRISPGVKWGHAAKVLSLFVRDLVLRSDYFSRKDVRRMVGFLHAPVDSIVIERFRELKVPLRFSRIKDIDSRSKFDEVQKALSSSASKAGVPRVWFDDNWGDRQ